MKRAVIYVRESTDKQDLSAEVQETRARQYAAMRDLEVVEVVRDVATSAGTPLAARRGGTELLALADAGGADAIIAMKLDRMFRNTVDCLVNADRWSAQGIGLHLIDMGGVAVDTQSPAGRFMLTVLAGAAEMDRNRIRERTRDALRHMKRNGSVYGQVPFGYRRACGHRSHTGTRKERPAACQRLEPDPDQQITLDLIRSLRESGMAYMGIAWELNRLGRATAKGTRWHPGTVRAVLLNDIHDAA